MYLILPGIHLFVLDFCATACYILNNTGNHSMGEVMHKNAAFNSLLFPLLSVMVLFQFGCPPRDDDPIIPVPAAITADFSASPLTGYAPLAVQFTDESTSTSGITSWSWDFGDGGTSASQDPDHTYSNAGSFTVTLTVTGPDGSDTQAKAAYIVVSSSSPVANFTADVTSGDASLTVQFTDTSTGLYDTWSWDFNGDGPVDSEDQNPSYIYTQAGTYDVTLVVDGPDGDSWITKTGYIIVY